MKRLGLMLSLIFFVPNLLAADLEVSNGWIRLITANVPAAGYFELRNTAATPAELVGVTSPAFAEAMLHRTVQEKGRSTMMHVHAVPVPAGGEVEFRPGGYHIMLMQPTRALRIGEQVPVTLEFGNGEKVSAQFEVRGPAGK